MGVSVRSGRVVASATCRLRDEGALPSGVRGMAATSDRTVGATTPCAVRAACRLAARAGGPPCGVGRAGRRGGRPRAGDLPACGGDGVHDVVEHDRLHDPRPPPSPVGKRSASCSRPWMAASSAYGRPHRQPCSAARLDAVAHLVADQRQGAREQHGTAARPTPEQILAERFARGEINEDEYQHRLDLLTGGPARWRRRSPRRLLTRPGAG